MANEWSVYKSRRTKRRSDCGLSLLLKKWPNAMNEIIKYVKIRDLLELRKTSKWMKKLCNKEIYEKLCQKWHGFADYEECEELNYHYEIGKCICGEHDNMKNVTYDPDCLNRYFYDYDIRHQKLIEVSEAKIDVLLNPKLKDLIW